MGDVDADRLLEEGIDLFNRRYFFEAHDVWEEIWQEERGPSRDFLKGLIHLAGGFHHHANGNWRGSAALLTSGIRYLTAYLPGRMGVDLQGLLPRVEEQLEKVLRLRDGSFKDEAVVYPTIARQ